MSAVALILIAVGSALGALGASSMFWRKKTQEELKEQAKAPKAKKRWKRKGLAREAREELEKREELRDSFTLWGWGFVLVGSIGAVIAEFLK